VYELTRYAHKLTIHRQKAMTQL